MTKIDPLNHVSKWLERQENHVMKASNFVYFSKSDAQKLIDWARMAIETAQAMREQAAEDDHD